MKYLNMSGLLLGLALVAASCGNKKDDQTEKIAELEQKLARLEASQPMPANAASIESADPSTLGKFSFKEMEYDFGTINEGQVVEHVFKFVNDGQAPLVISNVTASCGCTTPDYSRTPVKPGEEGFVKVMFNSTAKPGAQAPTVTIQANTSPNVTRLRMRGEVTPRLSAASPGQMGPVKR